MAPRAHARRQANRAHTQADLIGLVAGGLIIGSGFLLGWTSPVFIGAALAVGAFAIGWKESLRHCGNRWASGENGEEAVARRLRRLRRHGWTAIHDIDTGRGNIDHVAIGPGGVVAIETKNHARLDRVSPRMYAQARRNAARVAEATGREVAPVLVLVRARVHRRDRRNEEGVTVLRLDELNRHLRRLPSVLRPDEIAETAAHVASIGPPTGERQHAARPGARSR